MKQLNFLLFTISLLAFNQIPGVVSFRREPIDPTGTLKDQASYTLDAKAAMNICPCDITQGKCDAYCCCDWHDCHKDVIAFWRDNYSQYCAKNAVSDRYSSSLQKCIDPTLIRKTNKADGMNVTERDGKTCIQMGVAGQFSEFKQEIPKIIEAQAVLEPDLLH